MFHSLRSLARPRGSPITPNRLIQQFDRPLQRNLGSSSRKNAYVRFSLPGQPQKPKNPYDFRSWDPRVKGAAILGGGGALYYVANLEQVPETGRWRFMNTPPEAEAKFGEMARQQMRQELGASILPPNHPLSRHVRRVVTRILHASNLGSIKGEERPNLLSRFGLGTDVEGNSWNPDADMGAATNPGSAYGPQKEWDVIVVNDKKTVNAMAMPGLIVVFTGILPVCQDEEGLASVLGHEIGHVVARHTAERISSSTILFGVVAVLQLLGVDYGLSNLISTFAFELPNSRTQEREADLIGLRLMSRACYDPSASPEMFKRLGKVEEKLRGSMNLDFLQTHPSSESRVKFLEERLNEGYSILADNPECADVRHKLDEFKRSSRELKITDGGFEFA